uniref:Uncharacterized protein n=1 Tax=Anopheles culicifacies TaxID=139723 RepID=A0A182MFN0_9DIPT
MDEGKKVRSIDRTPTLQSFQTKRLATNLTGASVSLATEPPNVRIVMGKFENQAERVPKGSKQKLQPVPWGRCNRTVRNHRNRRNRRNHRNRLEPLESSEPSEPSETVGTIGILVSVPDDSNGSRRFRIVPGGTNDSFSSESELE